jgi:hypothetical protein
LLTFYESHRDFELTAIDGVVARRVNREPTTAAAYPSGHHQKLAIARPDRSACHQKLAVALQYGNMLRTVGSPNRTTARGAHANEL